MHFNASQVPGFGDLTNVSVEKLQKLKTVFRHILALSIARDTYAQIIDGTPTRTPFSDEIKESRSTFYQTIIDSDNTKPTDKATQKYEGIRSKITPQDLVIDLKVAQNYQNAPSGSRENNLRLLETAAASVHSLAGMIYASKHEDMDVNPPEPPGGHLPQFHHTDGYYVNFYHTEYKRFEDFPFGLLNVVGYWAETELFGGVVLFERSEGSSGITNAFIHPQRTSRAFQLSDHQLQDFANLSRASDSDRSIRADTLLPFAKEPNARVEPTFVRVGQAPLGIYKNEYDKQPLCYIPVLPSCVIMEDDPRAASMKECIRLIKENSPDESHVFNARLWVAGFTAKEASSSSSSSSSQDGPSSPANKEDK